MNRWSALAVLLALAAAVALRVPKLDTRPFHNDEGVNAVKVSELWQHGRYQYDPDEYHGPTLHYATLPFLWLSSARNSDELKDSTLRLAPVVFGIGLILLLLLFVDGLGRPAVVWAAIFTAVSPAMVFYSRYFIHEMLLVFFSGLTIGAGWRYAQTRSARWAITAGTGLGLMFATKETCVLSFAAMALATAAVVLWSKREQIHAGKWRHAVLCFVAASIVWLLFFSSFFTNFAGLRNSFLTYLPWLNRAGGHSPHIHPWSFYLERLAWFHPVKGPAWSEGLILSLAVVGVVASFIGRKPLHRFLALYTIILTALYSAISYKTPWCLLNFYVGMILLAGIGAAALVDFFRTRSLKLATATVLLAFTMQLSWQAWRANFVYPADRRNPYVYAQTTPKFLELVQRAEGIARVAPTGYETIVKVIAPENDYWPLPWYLRRFKDIGWYEKLPSDPFAPIMIVSSKFDARFDEKSDKKWLMVELAILRPGKSFELYVELELWKKYVETLPRDQE